MVDPYHTLQHLPLQQLIRFFDLKEVTENKEEYFINLYSSFLAHPQHLQWNHRTSVVLPFFYAV